MYEPQPNPRHINLYESRAMLTPHVPTHDQLWNRLPAYIAFHIVQKRACMHEHRVLEMKTVRHGEHLDTLT